MFHFDESDHEWAHYWRATDRPVEAMHAHFRRHTYHRHSHETYSFGVTDDGAQAFTCRGGAHTSGAGMVMAFNPDDPHDGRSAAEHGFTYRMVHIGPELIPGLIDDVTGGPGGLPLFTDPIVCDPRLAFAVRGLHAALTGGASALRRDELLAAVVTALAVRGGTGRPRVTWRSRAAVPRVARLTREALDASVVADLGADDLAAAAGCSRYTVYRAFRAAYGMAPSDYRRQVRLRAARRLLAAGRRPAEVAAETGFADQGHLTRWFGRYYGITPGAYRTATVRDASEMP